jgi:hypothetical protein
MSYFNHSFSKRFLANGVTRNLANTGAAASATNPYSTGGFITTAAVTSATLSNISLAGVYTPGYVMFADKNYQSLTVAGVAGACCEVYLVSTSLLTNDKIGPSHGGYRETNKSKLINPKYVHKVYQVNDCMPQQSVTSIGTTTETSVPGLPATGFQGGTVQADCQKDFYCDETYYLRIDIKGSPALRFLNHNAYQTVMAYTGCCAGPTPTEVDPTTVYISWANEILSNPYIKDFVLPVVFDTTGTAWFAPGTTLDPFTGLPFVGNTWDNYTPVAGVAGLTAGMRLFGAYVDTKFNNCTFQVTDFFEKQPIRILASLVDYTGDPCVFEGLCVYNDCLGIQGNGFGEQVLRDLIMSESYLQNFVASNDFRIREITQGTDIIDSVNRNAMYTRYYIQHVVPRFNNPSGVFDNDRYLLEIITPSGGNVAIEAFLTAWLAACVDCATLEVFDCTDCDIEPNVLIVP